jgi:hypothetical protein
MLGSWPDVEAVVKSVASCVSCAAPPLFPLEVSLCAADCKLAAICFVTCAYSDGLVCCSCCSWLNNFASVESWLLSDCPLTLLALLPAVVGELMLRKALLRVDSMLL